MKSISGRGTFVALSMFVLAIFVSSATHAAEGDPKMDARAALEEFIEQWNTGDNVKVRPTLNYPHMTLFGDRMMVAETAADFTTDFEGMRKSEGWHRSTLDNLEYGLVSENKVHCVMTYSRWNATKAYRTSKVYYVMTKVDGHWGMQFRAPMRGDSTEGSKEARALLDTFFVAFNGRDNDTLQKIANYPHAFLLNNGRTWQSKAPAEMVMNFESMEQREGWDKSTLDSVEVVHASDRMTIYDIVFSRHKADGTRYSSVPAMWILTKGSGDWGLQFRSLMPASFTLQE